MHLEDDNVLSRDDDMVSGRGDCSSSVASCPSTQLLENDAVGRDDAVGDVAALCICNRVVLGNDDIVQFLSKHPTNGFVCSPEN